jgi:hypothetical protein
VFELMSGPLDQPQDVAATVMEHKDAQESVIPFTVNPSTWYGLFLVPQIPWSVSLHTQIVFEKQGMVVNCQLRLACSPHGQGNFSDLRSFGQLDANATILLFPWNPGGYLCGGSKQRNIVFPATNICAHWPVPGICDAPAIRSPLAILGDEWVLPLWDFRHQSDVSYDHFSCANWLLLVQFLAQAKEQYGILMYVSKLAEPKLIVRFHEIESWWNYMLHVWISWRSEVGMPWETIVLACFENGWDNLQFPMLTLVLEQERYMAMYLVQVLFFLAAPTIRTCKTVLSASIIHVDWYLCNQILSATVCRHYSLKYYWLDCKWRSRFLGVGPAHAVFHAFVLPERHLMETLQSGYLQRWAQKLPSTNSCGCAISFHVKGLQDVYVSCGLRILQMVEMLCLFLSNLLL